MVIGMGKLWSGRFCLQIYLMNALLCSQFGFVREGVRALVQCERLASCADINAAVRAEGRLGSRHQVCAPEHGGLLPRRAGEGESRSGGGCDPAGLHPNHFLLDQWTL